MENNDSQMYVAELTGEAIRGGLDSLLAPVVVMAPPHSIGCPFLWLCDTDGRDVMPNSERQR